MLEVLGLLYGFAKDLCGLLKYTEEDMVVDMEWLNKSGFGAELDKMGYELRWSKPEKIASRMIDGWDIVCEVDKIKRIKRRIVLRDGLTLIGRLKQNKG